MRLYGRSFARNYVDRRAASRIEGRDAIIWDVDTVNLVCRCKIQGSGEYIIAHYPRNWKTTPYWLKPGLAVRILHRAGRRGYIEVAGEGRAIPTPVSGAAMPTAPTLSDGVISGCIMSAPGGMYIGITNGTYRINGTVYDFNSPTGYIVMDDPAPMVMGAGTPMGMNTTTVLLNSAPSEGSFRYELICVGTDGVADYIPGTVSTEPVKPSLPSDHVQLGSYILVKGGVLAVTDTDIGAEWQSNKPALLDVVVGDSEMDWDFGNDYPETTIQVTVKDQYGWNLPTTPDGYPLTLSKEYGSGQVWSAGSGWKNDSVTQDCSLSYTFKYRRDQTQTEHSCIFKITLDLTPALSAVTFITLLDAGGNPIA